MSKILFLADEISQFIKDHDSTWALMQASNGLGHEVHYSKTLLLRNSEAFAECLFLTTEFFSQESQSTNYFLSKPDQDPCIKALDDFDLICMRKDPPVDQQYINDCQILNLCKKAKVINNPQSLISFNEKLSIFNFPNLITKTIVTNKISEIKDFLDQNKKIVLKPLNAKGGEGIFVLEKHDKNFGAILESLLGKALTNHIMVQKYIEEIAEGDKRIILSHGKPIGALLRKAKEDDNRANLAAGGHFEPYTINDRDLEICSRLEAFLLKHGLYLAGIDLIGSFLTEINITSPTCLQEINRSQKLEDKHKLEYQFISATL